MSLDISAERRLAHAGIPSAKARLDDVVGWLNTTFRRCLGSLFVEGHRSEDVYVARFRTEDAARVAMGWVEEELSDLQVTARRSGVNLTGLLGRAP